MTDALRTDRPSVGDNPDRDRDARIEELLLAGLDHYFAGRHELAINVWTRVLFLDRSHGKARAYIERARGALAEKQREAEELLHTGAAALDRGDHAVARELLSSAANRTSGNDEALALLHRLDRLEAAGPALRPRSAARGLAIRIEDDAEGAVLPGRDARMAWVATGIAAGVLLAAVGGGYLWLVADPFEVARTPAPVLAEPALPVPAGCELRLARARLLFGEGKLHEAQRLLEPGDPDQLHRAAFDELHARIQRQLLDRGRRDSGFGAGAERAPVARPKPGEDAPHGSPR